MPRHGGSRFFNRDGLPFEDVVGAHPDFGGCQRKFVDEQDGPGLPRDGGRTVEPGKAGLNGAPAADEVVLDETARTRDRNGRGVDAREKFKNGARFAAARGARDIQGRTGVVARPPKHEISNEGFVKDVIGIGDGQLSGGTDGLFGSDKPRDRGLGRKSKVSSRDAGGKLHCHAVFPFEKVGGMTPSVGPHRTTSSTSGRTRGPT